jgi:hypothetical protein
MINRYRAKPIEVEAVQFTDNAAEIIEWADGDVEATDFPTVLSLATTPERFEIHVGDYVMKDADGNVSVIAPDLFRARYEGLA